MTHWIAVFGCALTLALVIPFGNQAEAARKKCMAPAMAGAKTTWVCKASEKCCYDWLLRKGTCPSARCF